MKITTKQELLDHINAHKGQNVPLFSALGMHKCIVDDTIKSHHKIEVKQHEFKNGNKSEFEFLHINGDSQHSLHDRHLSGIEQNYNDNWWFTTRKEAEDYIK